MPRSSANRAAVARGPSVSKRARPGTATSVHHGFQAVTSRFSDAEDIDFLMARCETKPAKDVRDNLGVVVNEARYQGKCTIITQHGKAAAAVVPIEGLSTMLRASGSRAG